MTATSGLSCSAMLLLMAWLMLEMESTPVMLFSSSFNPVVYS